jgi:hypothetical protein
MNFCAHTFLLTTLLSSAVFGMEKDVPEGPKNKISFTYGEHADVGALYTKLSTLSATDEQAQDFLADPELQALFEHNMQEQGLALNIFHKTRSLLKHHNKMVSLLESPKIALSKTAPTKLDTFFGWTDSLYEYTQMNGIPKMAYLSSVDLLELQKGKEISSEEKTYITSLIKHLKDRVCSSGDPAVLSFTPDVISNIFSTAKTEEAQHALINALTRMLRMSRDYFINIERKKVSLYQDFMNDLSENFDQTLTGNQDSIGTFLILHNMCGLLNVYGNKYEFKIAATKESVEKKEHIIHNLQLSNLLLEAESDLSPFYAGFFKSDITKTELPRVTSLQAFTLRISFNETTLQSDMPTPLDVRKDNVLNEEIHKIIKTYNNNFKDKKSKRNKVFTPMLMADVLSLNYSRAKSALAKLNAAYSKFEQEKPTLHHTYNQKILDILTNASEASSDVLTPNAFDMPTLEMAKDSESTAFDSACATSIGIPVSASEAASKLAATQEISEKEPEKKKVADADVTTEESLPIRKEKRWHTQDTAAAPSNSKIPTEEIISASSATTYLYENQTNWPDWISALKSDKVANMTEILKGFAQPISRNGLGGVALEYNNKYTLSFLSPITHHLHTAKAHALHKGTDDKRYPAIRKVLIEMLEEAHIIQK